MDEEQESYVDWWVPESPNGTLYAQKGGLVVTDTTDIHKALYFTNRIACQRWCDGHRIRFNARLGQSSVWTCAGPGLNPVTPYSKIPA